MTESTIAEEVGGVAVSRRKCIGFTLLEKIKHILTSSREETAHEEEPDDHQDDVMNGESQSSIGIFLTPRSLYGKQRLSKMMINGHYMPIYRRNTEQLISEVEKDSSDPIGDNLNFTSS
ncbi:unnamed protein product [Urochloa humidicola]